jgi:hypothetical protein
MAATGKFYPMAHDSFAQKKIDIDSDTIKVMLLSAYTYAATHQYVSDVKGAGTEASGTGYSAGGATLGSVTWTRSTDVYKFDAADTSWTTTGGALTAKYAVIYDSTPGSDATNPVIGYINLDGSGGDVTSTNGTFSIVWNAGGIFTQTAS